MDLFIGESGDPASSECPFTSSLPGHKFESDKLKSRSCLTYGDGGGGPLKPPLMHRMSSSSALVPPAFAADGGGGARLRRVSAATSVSSLSDMLPPRLMRAARAWKSDVLLIFRSPGICTGALSPPLASTPCVGVVDDGAADELDCPWLKPTRPRKSAHRSCCSSGDVVDSRWNLACGRKSKEPRRPPILRAVSFADSDGVVSACASAFVTDAVFDAAAASRASALTTGGKRAPDELRRICCC